MHLYVFAYETRLVNYYFSRRFFNYDLAKNLLLGIFLKRKVLHWLIINSVFVFVVPARYNSFMSIQCLSCQCLTYSGHFLETLLLGMIQKLLFYNITTFCYSIAVCKKGPDSCMDKRHEKLWITGETYTETG